MGEGYTDTQSLPKVLQINSYEALRVKDVCVYLEVLSFLSKSFKETLSVVKVVGINNHCGCSIGKQNAMKHNWAVLIVIEQMIN